MINSLDGSLRTHVQEAVALTQRAVQSRGERVHLLDTARDFTAASLGMAPTEARTAVDAAETRKRFSELELKLLSFETAASEQKVERLGAERDLCAGVASLRDDLTRLEAQTSGSCAALGKTLTGLVHEAQRLRSKFEGPLGQERPLVWRCEGRVPERSRQRPT